MKKLLSVVLLIMSVLIFYSCTTNDFFDDITESDIRHQNISIEYYNIAKAYEDQKNYAKAIDYYLLAQHDKKLRYAADYELGRCYALNKDWDNAQKYYEKLLNRDPDNANIKISLAYITAMKGDLGKACAMYSSLVKENPYNCALLKNYISILITDGKYEMAEEQYYILKERFPDDKDAEAILSKIASSLK